MSEENRSAGSGPEAGTPAETEPADAPPTAVPPVAGIPADASPAATPLPDVRQRILEAAVDLFGTRGVAGTTTRAIAEAAGVSTSVLLHHYISRDALADACEDYVVRTILEEKLGGHSVAEAAARVLGDPKLESRLRFIGRQIKDGSRSGTRMFDRMVAETRAVIGQDVAGMRWKTTAETDALAVVLATYGLAPLLFADHLARHFGTAPYSAETMRRIGPALLELYVNGVIEPAAGGGSEAAGPDRQERGRHSG